MIIHKTFSKQDLVDLINDLNLPITHSHQDNKKSLQGKFIECLKKDITIDKNFYNLENKEQLIHYLENSNSRKVLTIKEKDQVMKTCKRIIQYCKSNYDITITEYNTTQDIIDDMNWIKQYGDIPSVRRCCKLMDLDIKMGGLSFKPLISPQVKRELDAKKKVKDIRTYQMTVRYASEEEPIILSFD